MVVRLQAAGRYRPVPMLLHAMDQSPCQSRGRYHPGRWVPPLSAGDLCVQEPPSVQVVGVAGHLVEIPKGSSFAQVGSKASGLELQVPI